MSQRELGGVGEGVSVIDRAQPLTQLQLGSKLQSFRNPLPLERDIPYPVSAHLLLTFCSIYVLTPQQHMESR